MYTKNNHLLFVWNSNLTGMLYFWLLILAIPAYIGVYPYICFREFLSFFLVNIVESQLQGAVASTNNADDTNGKRSEIQMSTV